MGQTLQYLIAALALGLISYCGSEAMFWSFPPDGISLLDWVLTVCAYSLAAACALSAVGWAGLGGWRGVFLGGAIVGFLVEGVIVDTMYDAFPFQLVWTPLAWQAVVTSLGVLALHRAACGKGLWRHLALMVAFGLCLGFFAGFWPTERQDLPPVDAIFQYQIGSGLAAVVGLLALDRLGQVPRPRRLVGLAVPALAAVLWLGKSIADPRPERLVLPVMLGLTLWAMHRLGTGKAVGFGPTGRLRHGILLIVPALVAVAAGLVFRDSAGIPSHIFLIVILGPLGLGLWLWCLFRAFRTPAPQAPPKGQ